MSVLVMSFSILSPTLKSSTSVIHVREKLPRDPLEGSSQTETVKYGSFHLLFPIGSLLPLVIVRFSCCQLSGTALTSWTSHRLALRHDAMSQTETVDSRSFHLLLPYCILLPLVIIHFSCCYLSGTASTSSTSRRTSSLATSIHMIVK